MARFNTVLFDFDGTLADSLPAVGRAILETLAHFGIDGGSVEDMRPYIGPPLRDSFANYPVIHEHYVEALEFYREAHGRLLELYEVYDGIAEVLVALKSAGITVGVATAKWETNAVDILRINGLLEHFDFVAGVVEGTRNNKNEVIGHALTLSGDRQGVVMVGDRHYDINGGKAFGLQTVGCLWGFGSREELEECGADVIVAKPSDLPGVLL